MCLFQYDDPDPGGRVPAGLFYVPVRPGAAGVVVRIFRTPLGARTAVGFTHPARLAATLGAEQPWIRLSEPALRALGAPLGAAVLTVDPTFTAPAVTAPPTAASPAAGPAPVPAPRRAAATPAERDAGTTR
ncbi:SAV_915 family protein [Streptomyces toxytricini]|uniref:SAV_915 family protein n=1 Tax=Streptomyces toxytricini TaxID=67369 RepID=UPI003446C96F